MNQLAAAILHPLGQMAPMLSGVTPLLTLKEISFHPPVSALAAVNIGPENHVHNVCKVDEVNQHWIGTILEAEDTLY